MAASRRHDSELEEERLITKLRKGDIHRDRGVRRSPAPLSRASVKEDDSRNRHQRHRGMDDDRQRSDVEGSDSDDPRKFRRQKQEHGSRRNDRDRRFESPRRRERDEKPISDGDLTGGRSDGSRRREDRGGRRIESERKLESPRMRSRRSSSMEKSESDRFKHRKYKDENGRKEQRSERSLESPRKTRRRSGRYSSEEDFDSDAGSVDRKYKDKRGERHRRSGGKQRSESSDDDHSSSDEDSKFHNDGRMKDNRLRSSDHRPASPQPWLDRTNKTDGEEEKKPQASVQQMEDAMAIRTGGIYIPPHRMAQMMRDVQDKNSEAYQRLSWDALRKSINGLVNKVNSTNIKNIIPELFSENLIRGRGLFCRSCMKSQMASPGFTDVFAALVAVVNSKFPEVGKLLLKRVLLQFKRSFSRNDKPQLLAATKFIAHLVNQQVAHEVIALELLTVLLVNPTDDSVEVAVGFVKECGALLQDLVPLGLHGVFERFRGILHEGEIDKRVQFLIEGLFAIRKAKFQGFPAIRAELDLVEQEDQFTHEMSFEDEIDPETNLDVFKLNSKFVEDEKAYENLKKSILGDESSDDEASSEEDTNDENDEESEEEDIEQMKIKDETETNLVNLRRTIYLTIMSSVDFEEAGHKLLKIKLESGQEMELCIMLLECCSQERTYLRYYGLLGQRFCMINKVYQENFEQCFVQQYSMIHRLETNKLRNVAKFFAHLLGTDALPWHVLAYIRLTEEDTTSSSRIFIKILFQELSEHLGIRLLNERLNDPSMNESFESIFPKDNPKNTRFSINFFTSIGLGGITENLREYLKNMPRLIMQQQKPVSDSSDHKSSSSSGSSTDISGPESSSDSESESKSSSSSGDRRRVKKPRKR